jgi:sugar/nucleoside kinase (ribokinase family)
MGGSIVPLSGPAERWIEVAPPRVLAVGMHILDVLGRPVDSLPPGQGSVPLEEIRLTAAGTAAGTAVDLAKLGAQVTSIGCIGDDAAGRLVVELLAGHGVDVSRMAVVTNAQTATTILPIRSNGERPALHVRGAAPMMTLDLLDRRWMLAVDVVHLGGPDALGPFGGDPAATMLAWAKEAGVITTLDLLRPGEHQSLERLAPVLALSDYFLPNSDQLLGLTGTHDLAEAAKCVLELGVKAVGVTLGRDGCAVFSEQESFQLPAADVGVVDTTGCGDAFSAGFIRAVASGADLEEAAWVGTAAAALVAQGLGSDAGIVDLTTTLDFLSSTPWHRPLGATGRSAPPSALIGARPPPGAEGVEP